jgi:hypothetical protein
LISYAQRHEDIWGSGYIAPPFLTSELNGGEWSILRPGRFTLGERASGTHWIGGWVGPRVGLITSNAHLMCFVFKFYLRFLPCLRRSPHNVNAEYTMRYLRRAKCTERKENYFY